MGKIDDAQIKDLIRKYQQTGDELGKIIQLVSEYIYNYPRIRFNQSEDHCGEFYLYFYKRLPRALLKYMIQDCQFTTWLTVVLRRHYINWIKKTKKENDKPVLYIEDFKYGRELQARDGSNDLLKGSINDEGMKDILNSLPRKVRVVMKLYFFDFFKGEDLLEVSRVFEKDFSELIDKYDKMLPYAYQQYDQEKELLDKLNTSFNNLLSYKERLKSIDEKSFSYGGKENLLKKVDYHHHLHEKNLNNFRRFRVSMTNEMISDFLGISVNAVHNLVYRGKALLKQKLKDKKLC